MDEDLKLVQEVLNGNIDSVTILVSKYELSILRLVHNTLRDRKVTEDITQEVFIDAYNKLYIYNKKYTFSNWLYQIAKSKSVDYIRKYKREYEANVEEVHGIISGEVPEDNSTEIYETKNLVIAFMNKLNDVDKQIVLMRYTNDLMTFTDIAKVLGMGESVVKRRYYKTRERFRKYTMSREKRCK